MKKIFLIGALILAALFQAKPQMQVFPNLYTPSQLVLDVLITGCLQASNVVYTGDLNAKGYFTYTGAVSGFPFSNGIILSSGSATGAAGPNNTGASTTPNSGGPYPLLATVITGGNTNTNNASVLEFDFIPADNIIDFRYVFGSDEYPEWVNSSFNDVFAFFLTGPNPLGPAYNNKNIAIVPATINTPVSINNVNIGMNSTYYVTNTQGIIQYDGYTTALTAHAAVVPCANYHIRLAISDVGDSAYDSGVFLEGGSMISGEVVQMNNINPVGDDNIIYEGCENYYIFSRTDPTDVSTSILVLLNISGTATPNVDITGFPTSINIPVGVISDTIFYSAILDNIPEGVEYIVFTLLNGCPCTVGSTRDTIWILENNAIDAGIINNDTLICSTTPIPVVLHGYSNTPASITHYQWTSSSGIINNPTSASITVTPPPGAVTTYTLQVVDDCGQVDVDQVQITVSNMSTINISPQNLICNGVCTGSILVSPTSGFPPYTYNWIPQNSGPPSSGVANNLCSGQYMVTVTDQFGCKASGSVSLSQPPAVSLSLSQTPSTCPGANDGQISVDVTNGVPPFTFTCTSLPFPITTSSSSYTFLNLNSGNYIVNVVDFNGCHGTASINVGQLQLSYNISVSDATCFNKSNGSATIYVSGGTPPYTYNWFGSSSNLSTANGLIAGNYSVSVTDSHNCLISVPITIDHPDSLTISNSEDTIMCFGEMSNLYVNANGGTPPYNYYWNNLISTSNISVSPTHTSIYSVYCIDSNGCRSVTNNIKVTINPDVSLYSYTNQDSICLGDSVIISLIPSGGNGGPYSFYFNGSMVSSPLILYPDTTINLQFEAKDDCGSPKGTSNIKIWIMNPPESNITMSNVSGCQPLFVEFDDITQNDGQSYLWYFGDSDFGYSINKNPIYVFNNPGVFDIKLETTSEFGCINLTVCNGAITVYPSPYANFIMDHEVSSLMNPTIYFQNLSVGQNYNYWSFGDYTELISNDNIISHTYNNPGIYDISLIVDNSDGCSDTITKTLRMNDEFTFYVPNVINPLSTFSQNNVFMAVGEGFDSNNFHMVIYDRWNGKIYETFDPIHGWDGRFKGDIVPIGTYGWVIIYKDKEGLEHLERGSVTVLY